MTVYVDDMRAPFGQMLMCHMIADAHVELLLMADRIGVNRKWIQKPGTAQEHFDIAMSKRAKAVAAGAREITWRQCSLMCANREKTGRLGDPASCEDVWRGLHAGGDPSGPWADAAIAGPVPIKSEPIAPRCACGEYASFYRGDEAWCRACLPQGFLPGAAAPRPNDTLL